MNNLPCGSTAGLQGLLFKFHYSDNSVAIKQWTKYFGWDMVHSFLQHDVQELNRVLCEKVEKGTEGVIGQLFDPQHINYIECIHVDNSCSRKESFDTQHGHKGCRDVYALFSKYVHVKHLEGHEHHAVNRGLQVGQLWELSNNADNADLKLFSEAEVGLALPPVKSNGDIVLLFKHYSPEKELCFVGRLSINASGKPSEIMRKQKEIAGFTPYKGTEFHEAGVRFTFTGISYMYIQEPTLGLLHPRLQLCKHFFRSNSSSKRHLSSLLFRVLPKLLPLSYGLPNKLKKDEHFHPQLMEIGIGDLPDLPQEILMDIFGLLEIPDLVRAGSVCSSWNSAYTRISSIGLYRRLQTPCLIYTSESAGESVACLYSLAEKKTYKMTLPEPPIHRRYLIGSSNGWLVTVDEQSEMHLVNPITSEQITLPSVITIEHVTPIFDDTGAICKYQLSERPCTGRTATLALHKLRDYLHHKALLFHDTSAGSHIVVLIHGPNGQLSFARLGDEKWTWLPPHAHIEDCIYKDGLLYAVTIFGEIVAFNLSGTRVTTKIVMDRLLYYAIGTDRVYIAQAPWGDLLQVRKPQVLIKEELDGHGHDACADHAIFQNNDVRMKIYKVCSATKRLVEINTLDDHVLFLGHNQSLCSRAEDYPQLKPNHVYFTDDSKFESFKSRWGYRLVTGALNLENKSLEEIVSPRPWSNCRTPLLIIPNLSKMDSALHN